MRQNSKIGWVGIILVCGPSGAHKLTREHILKEALDDGSVVL